jgi:outer membrane protein assembly factor BamB
MNRRFVSGMVALGAAAAWTVAVPGAQTRRKADWLTDGGDPQRTAWQRNETILTKDNVKDAKLLWKIQLDNQPRQMHNLFPPLIAGNVSTSTGEKEIAVVAGVSDNVYGIDVASGALLWKRKFDSTFQEQTGGRGGGVLCPGGLTATPVLDQRTPGRYVAYAVSWDGRLRTLDVATGEETEPPALFVPPNGKPYGLNLVNGVIYTSTAQGCGGNPNNFYSFDLATKKVGNWDPGSGGLWPRTGPSVGKDGTVYAGSGDGDYLPEQQI